ESGRVVGGKQVADGSYPWVGALVYNHELHCTGTLIGPRTVLTAGHCVYDYKAERMSFVLGTNFMQPQAPGVFEAARLEYPMEGEGGFNFSSSPFGLDDDIGLVYLNSAPPITPFALRDGSPSSHEIKTSHQNLTFVGFGYNVVENQLVDKGVKRMVDMG